jgi:hypothetical protein
MLDDREQKVLEGIANIPGQLIFSREPDSLKNDLPDNPPSDTAFAFRISGPGLV